jgi:transglycosylase-like protein with SLT domain
MRKADIVHRWARWLPLSLVAIAMASCSSDDEGGDPDTDVIAWVSPAPNAAPAAGEVVQLTVKVNDATATAVRFVVDGQPLATCDTTAGPDECRRDDLFRTTTSFDVGHHRLEAIGRGEHGERSAALSIEVHAVGSADPTTQGDPPEPQPAPPPKDRGFLDPDRPLHSVFDGVRWAVDGQRVKVEDPPAGKVASVAACMKKYGKSIVKHADAYKVSRASVVATAITESNCTNPAGSSDGLSAGPMQVTGSTCAGVVKGYSSSACKAKMHADPDFSFQVGAKYMGSSGQLKQHSHDPPKIGAAYNAGSVRRSSANRWHMVVTGNHLERYVGAYNAYRAWESMTPAAKAALDDDIAIRPETVFGGEHVASFDDLPEGAPEGQVYFVGDWSRRDGHFVTLRDGKWQP